jgi:hypothetical protein
MQSTRWQNLRARRLHPVSPFPFFVTHAQIVATYAVAACSSFSRQEKACP